MDLRLLGLIAVALSSFSVHARPWYLHQAPSTCTEALSVPTIKLSDLIYLKFVEPDNRYLYSPSEAISDHEYDTANLLAQRLRRKIALLPRVAGFMHVPTVDGIIFNPDGTPDMNFSLKTWMPSSGRGTNLNRKLAQAIEDARRAVETNYNYNRWKEIICKRLSPKVSASEAELECRVHAKLFGILDSPRRPVSLVIDYTQDETAIFQTNYVHGAVKPSLSLTLIPDKPGLDILQAMDEIRVHPVIKEVILLGAHNMFRMNKTGYQMTEYCDFGHTACQ